MTDKEKLVINEYINTVKSPQHITYLDDRKEALTYDFINGKGAAIELLNEYFYEIIKNNDLTQKQIKELASIIQRRENKWYVANKDIQDYSNHISYDGHAYIVLTNGDRVDESEDMYKEEREAFNKERNKRLASQKTNGQEYL